MKYREEKDALGSMKVPAQAYYGAQTQRAVENFPVSGLMLPPAFMHTLALIKKYAARVNRDLGLMEPKPAEAIITAAEEVVKGKFDDQFVIDIFQTGSATSTNMNMNEVIASRANEMLTGKKGGKKPVHPNDHVNMGQSSNDVIPTTLHVAACVQLHAELAPALKELHTALAEKVDAFADVRKLGRTHLQDAVPMFLGDEFSGYARQVALGIKRVKHAQTHLLELALGGTAVGSGLNAHPHFARDVIRIITEHTGLGFIEAENHFEAQAARDAAVEASGALKVLAVSLMKIANDIRWLASGPRCGIGEINIPTVQPGSSIMPAKVNPVMAEALIQVGMQVIGNDAAITAAGQAGNFELSLAMPLMAYNLLQSIEILASASRVFARKCVQGITANREKCAENIEKSLALVTVLVPHVGYDRAAAVAQKAHAEGKTIRQVVLEENLLDADTLKQLLG